MSNDNYSSGRKSNDVNLVTIVSDGLRRGLLAIGWLRFHKLKLEKFKGERSD